MHHRQGLNESLLCITHCWIANHPAFPGARGCSPEGSLGVPAGVPAGCPQPKLQRPRPAGLSDLALAASVASARGPEHSVGGLSVYADFSCPPRGQHFAVFGCGSDGHDPKSPSPARLSLITGGFLKHRPHAMLSSSCSFRRKAVSWFRPRTLLTIFPVIPWPLGTQS